MSGMIFLTISKVAIFATLAVVYFYLATRERTRFFWIAFEAWLLLTLQGMLVLGEQDGLPGFVTELMMHTTPFLLASLLLWGVAEFANRPLPAGWFYTAGALFAVQLLTFWGISEPLLGVVSATLLLILYVMTAYFLKELPFQERSGWSTLFSISTLLYGLVQMVAYNFSHLLALQAVIVMCVTSVGVGLCLAYFDRLHESLQEKEQQLRLSEEKFSKMFFASPMATILSRVSDRRYIEVNDKFLELTGYSREEVIGQTAAALDIFYLKEQEQMIGESLATYGRAPTVEVVYQGKSGKLGVCLVSMEIISVGGEICFLSIVEDITTRRQVEEAMLQTQKLESLGVLAGGIAHDFNNLLVAMMGQTSLALTKLDGDARARANIEKALSAAEKAAALTQQLLSYAGQGVTEFRPTDLNELIQENLHLFKVAMPQYVTLKTKLAEIPLVEVDKNQIQQVVMNLIINGAEAIEGKSGTVLVTTAVYEHPAQTEHEIWLANGNQLPSGRYVLLTVEDDGMGMSAATMGKIFDPFFSTKFTGRGLGLAAALGIVQSHRGGLQVESVEHEGTTFSLYLPI